MTVNFDDIGGIDNYHCVNLLSTAQYILLVILFMHRIICDKSKQYRIIQIWIKYCNTLNDIDVIYNKYIMWIMSPSTQNVYGGNSLTYKYTVYGYTWSTKHAE